MSVETSSPQNETNVSPEQERARRMKKLIDALISLEDVDTHKIQPIIDSLREERDRKIAPLFHSLNGLVTLHHQHPGEKEVVDTLLSDTADLTLDDVKAIKKINRKSEVGIASVWDAINAWNIAPNESTAKLCEKMLDEFKGVGSAHSSLYYAYHHAKKTGIDFNDALDHANEAERIASKPDSDIGFSDALTKVYREWQASRESVAA